MDERITRPTYMEIDKDSFRYNISAIKKKVGNEVDLMPVIKANAYGTYINTQLDLINEFNIVAVATVDEAVAVRKIGYKKDIFVLNQPYKTEIQKIIDNDIVVGISSVEFAKELNTISKSIRVHLEIETGMGRTGIMPENVESFLNDLSDNVLVEGIYTHFSSADFDEEYTTKQIEKFNEALTIVKEKCKDLKYIHASASNGILNWPNAYFNLVRPGIIMYGYNSSKDTLDKIDIKPVAKLKSTVVFLKEVQSGNGIGYDHSFITSKSTKIATIPIGYADGFRRAFSNKGEVLIRGKKAPIIGKICMDSFMCDVTEVEDVSVGDEVVIWDNENILLDDLANSCNTINYELMTCISERVPRIFI